MSLAAAPIAASIPRFERLIGLRVSPKLHSTRIFCLACEEPFGVFPHCPPRHPLEFPEKVEAAVERAAIHVYETHRLAWRRLAWSGRPDRASKRSRP